MKRFLTLLALAICGSTACAQTNLTVVSDTNRAIRTNFTIGNAQVTGLSALLDAKLATNGNASALTNITAANIVGTVATASNITGILAISNGGTGSSSASNARTALGLGTAATNSADAFQPASTNLTALASGDGSSLTNVATTDASQLTNFPAEVLLTNSSDASFPAFLLRTNGSAAALTNFPAELLRTNGDGGGLTNLTATNFLPAYSGQDGKVLAVATGGTNIEWTAISNTVTDASTLTNFPSIILQTNSAETNFPAFLARTNADGAGFTNLAASNIVGTLSLAQGGTGATNAASARVALLPDYSNNATKVLALNSNATDVEWITQTSGGGTSGVTSVDVSGGTTGLTTSGGPITNSGTITIGGTLSIAAGGTGQTNAAAAIEALLPAYTNNADKILALNSNATGLVWTTNAGGGGGSGTVTSVDASGGSTGMNFTGGPITTNGTLTLGGTLAIGNGGTGASDVTNARVNLLPAYTNNAGKALAVNTNGTDLEWISVAAVPVSVANGGTGATNTTNALINLTLVNTNDGVTIGPSSSALSGVAIGNSARAVSTNGTDGANGVAIGPSAYASTNGVSIGHNSGSVSGVAIGSGALTGAEAIAIGKNSAAEPGIAIGAGAGAYEVGAVAVGDNARADNTNSLQIGTGTNSTDNVFQVRNWGGVASNSWGALANSTTIGREIMQAPTNGTDGQVLVWTNNDVAWTTVSGVQADMTNVTGVLAIANGGTGASNEATARANLLPALASNNIGYVLTVNSNATDVVWGAAGGSAVDLSTTNATGVLPVEKGGTGGTNILTAQTNLGIIGGSSSVHIAPSTTNLPGNFNVTIGATAKALDPSGVTLGYGATTDDGGESGAVAVGRGATATNGVALGYIAVNRAGRGVALGYGAVSSNNVQIGSGTNTDANTIQFRTFGTVDTNEWARIAALSTYPTTNISVVGTNNTNTLVFSNGILVEVQ